MKLVIQRVSHASCTVNGNITGKDRIGGIAGESCEDDFAYCQYFGDIKAANYVGGIVGVNANMNLSNLDWMTCSQNDLVSRLQNTPSSYTISDCSNN